MPQFIVAAEDAASPVGQQIRFLFLDLSPPEAAGIAARIDEAALINGAQEEEEWVGRLFGVIWRYAYLTWITWLPVPYGSYEDEITQHYRILHLTDPLDTKGIATDLGVATVCGRLVVNTDQAQFYADRHHPGRGATEHCSILLPRRFFWEVAYGDVTTMEEVLTPQGELSCQR